MASITISDLNHSESSLHELTEQETMYVLGGKFPWKETLEAIAAAAKLIAAFIK